MRQSTGPPPRSRQAERYARELAQAESSPLDEGTHQGVEAPPQTVTQAKANAAPPKPNGRGARSPSGQSRTTLPRESRAWPEPQSLPDSLPPVLPFHDELLPESLRPWVTDIAERLQVPIDMPAAAVTVGLAGVVGRRLRIRPKRADDWLVVPNLWGGVVARPGLMKTPVIREALRPMQHLRKEAFREFDEAVKAYESQLRVASLRERAWESNAVRGFKRNPDYCTGEAPDEPEKPKPRRYLVNDATAEKLHEILQDNPAGVLVLRDELTGWLANLEKPGREGERAFFLECWNGDGSFEMDRIIRGTVRVDAACVSMFGGIQPARLQSYLTDAVTGGPNDDGLVQRFQILVWPDHSRDWVNVDRAPDRAARMSVNKIFQHLATLDPEKPVVARFSSDAQQLFDEWRATLEHRVRGDSLHPALESHLSKYRSLMPSLALLFHSTRFVEMDLTDLETVGLEDTKRAAAWCSYLEAHARRIYSCLVAPEVRAAQELAKKIKAGDVGEEVITAGGQRLRAFALRDVYRNSWSGLTTLEVVRGGAEVLVDLGWLREVIEDDTGGRARSRYFINPAVVK